MLSQLLSYGHCCCDMVAARDRACCVVGRYGGQKVSQRDIQRLVRLPPSRLLPPVSLRAATVASTCTCARCAVTVMSTVQSASVQVHVQPRVKGLALVPGWLAADAALCSGACS
jgi:hypothetical protein